MLIIFTFCYKEGKLLTAGVFSQRHWLDASLRGKRQRRSNPGRYYAVFQVVQSLKSFHSKGFGLRERILRGVERPLWGLCWKGRTRNNPRHKGPVFDPCAIWSASGARASSAYRLIAFAPAQPIPFASLTLPSTKTLSISGFRVQSWIYELKTKSSKLFEI